MAAKETGRHQARTTFLGRAMRWWAEGWVTFVRREAQENLLGGRLWSASTDQEKRGRS